MAPRRRVWPLFLLGGAAALASLAVIAIPEAPPETPERVWAAAPFDLRGLLAVHRTPGGEFVPVMVVSSTGTDRPEEDRLQLGVARSLTARWWLGECNRRVSCYHPTGVEERVGGTTWREFRRAGEIGSMWWFTWSTCH